MRLTKMDDKTGEYTLDVYKISCHGDQCKGSAVDRLAAYENFYENLLERQEMTLDEMARLGRQGKTKTVTFRQLLASKLENMQVLNFLKSFGIGP